MEHPRHQKLEVSDLIASNLVDATIYGPEAEKIGSVSHFLESDGGDQVIVDIGPFLASDPKPVALAVCQMDFMRDNDGDVYARISLTKEQAETLPEHPHDAGE